MTVVLGSLEQLRRQSLDQKGRQQLGRAEWSARQAVRLTRQALSRSQGRDDRPEAADLNATVDGFVTMMGRHPDGGVQVATELVSERLPVRLDAGLLELVLLNLVRNATDAMPSGGGVVIRTRGPRLDGLGDRLTAEVSVSDEGSGMPPAVARRATEAFFTTKPHGEGTGLGLWMAHRFASECGGTVKIETMLGRGTTVRLVFPTQARLRKATFRADFLEVPGGISLQTTASAKLTPATLKLLPGSSRIPSFDLARYSPDTHSRRGAFMAATGGCEAWSGRSVRAGGLRTSVGSSAGFMGLTYTPSGSMR